MTATINDYDFEAGWALHASDRAAYAPPTMANGVLGLVLSQEPLQFQQVILGGVYDRFGDDDVARILSGIQVAGLDLMVNGRSLSSSDDLQDWRQTLNMREAHLTTAFIFASSVRVEQRVYVLRHMPHAVLVTLTLTALADVTVAVRHLLSAPAFLQPLAQRFRFYHETPGTPIVSSTALSPNGRHRISAAAAYLFPGDMPEITHEAISDHEHGTRIQVELKQGESYRFGVVGAICTTAHFDDPANEAERIAIFARFEGEERLIAKHKAAWHDLWESDIIIEGDLAAQRDVRFALYNLYSFLRAGARWSPSPMGLSSAGYNGHIFWDSELWMYPPLLALQPELARSMLDYRSDRMEAAQRKASNYGFQGVMFPWESDDTGEECTPTWAVSGAFEHHITACVAIAFWNYYLATGDKEWLRNYGYPMLEQIARFWVSRVEKNPAGRYEIKRVMGADEYTGVVDNNAFTNGAAITALRYASLAAQTLGREPDPQWRDIADKIVILEFEDGTTQEYEGYDGRVVKQADVNLLAYPLEIITEEARIRRDMAYYAPRFDENAPAMSHCVLSVLAARLGDCEQAHAYFKRSYQPNQKPPFGVLSETPFSNNPYFATAAGGMLQAVLFGFGGLAITEQGIVQRRSCLPPGWKSLTIKRLGVIVSQARA
jgi:trehalose/maltose hydrolase-like predicted phosphorylase